MNIRSETGEKMSKKNKIHSLFIETHYWGQKWLDFDLLA